MLNVAKWIESNRTMTAKDGSAYCGVATRSFTFAGKSVVVEAAIRAHGSMGAGKALAALVRLNGHKAGEILTSCGGGGGSAVQVHGFVGDDCMEAVAAVLPEMATELQATSAAAWGW